MLSIPILGWALMLILGAIANETGQPVAVSYWVSCLIVAGLWVISLIFKTKPVRGQQ